MDDDSSTVIDVAYQSDSGEEEYIVDDLDEYQENFTFFNIYWFNLFYSGREVTLDCELHWYLKFLTISS